MEKFGQAVEVSDASVKLNGFAKRVPGSQVATVFEDKVIASEASRRQKEGYKAQMGSWRRSASPAGSPPRKSRMSDMECSPKINPGATS